MKLRNKSRLARLDKAIHQRPLRRSMIDAAFEKFRETGELPEQQRLADAVTKKALDPGWDVVEETDPYLKHLRAAQARVAHHDAVAPDTDTDPTFDVALGHLRSIGDLLGVQPQPTAAGATRTQTELLERLYGEAVWAPEPVREIARKALMWHADGGDDVTTAAFLGQRKVPRFGTVGLMLLGYPDFLVRPPYEAQARRLFDRYGDLLEKKGPCDDAWERQFIALSIDFYRHGKLPADELMRDIILGSVEIDALFEHKRGGNVKELMAALDAAARAGVRKREAAIGKVVDLVLRMDVEIVGRIR